MCRKKQKIRQIFGTYECKRYISINIIIVVVIDATIVDLLKERGINILKKSSTFKFETVLYEKNNKRKKNNKTFRFPASLQIKDYNDFLGHKDLNEIEAKVYKVSSLGVFVKINGISGDIMISKSRIIKESEVSDINEIFEIEDKVIVQVTDKKKCVVIKVCEV